MEHQFLFLSFQVTDKWMEASVQKEKKWINAWKLHISEGR
jgi:hypothetical protein